MMKKITLLATFLIAAMSYGQNLAANGDFESSDPFDPTVHGQTTDDASGLSNVYLNANYFKRSGSGRLGFLEEYNTANAQGLRAAKLVGGVGMHIRYGIKPLLTPGTIKYTIKLDFLGDGSSFSKAFNVNLKQGANKGLSSIGSSYKPALGWTTWTGEFIYDSSNIDYDAAENQYLDIGIASGTTTDTYIDNLQILILACIEESIDIETGGTSALSIYASDVNNGAPITIGANANLTSHTFYEADGTTNANAKFTLNTDGTITSTGGTVDTNYKITYKLTSTTDADTSGTNDWDEITQTFSVVAPIVYLTEKLDYTFNTPGDFEGWADNTNVSAPTVVAGGEMTISLPDLPVNVDSAIKTLLDQTLNSVNPQNNDYVYIWYKNNSSNETFRFQITNNDGQNQGYVIDDGVTFKTNTTGYEVLQIDLSVQTKWSTAANATSFQIQLRNEVLQASGSYVGDITSPGTFVIDRILFSNDATLGVEKIEKEDVSLNLYPNPVSNILTVQSKNHIEKIEVYNLLGQKVLSQNSPKIDVSKLSKGIYISKIYQENDVISTKRFIKE